jgi:hypothetical protein
MKLIVLLSACLFLVTAKTWSQNDSKNTTNYASPLDIPLILASNFGELRPNHFHMGVDFKTDGQIGQKLYSIEKGYVARVVVSSFGYGKVVYIAHPNGVTSVYAHCHEFKGNLEKVISKKQKELKQNQIDLTFEPSEIPIKRREHFAMSGNTGSSTAPHLHFELRDTKTDTGLNPLAFGFDIKDTKPPEINRLKIYSLTDRGYRYPGKSRQFNVSGADGKYSCKDVIRIPSDFCSKYGGIGFSFDVIDRLDDARNPCGMYGAELYIDGKKVFGQQTDRVPFESTRFVNVHKDYEEYYHQKYNFHKAFKTVENDLPIYENTDGIIKAKPGDSLRVKYIARDVKGNKSIIEFSVVIEKGKLRPNDAIGLDLSYLMPGFPMKIKETNCIVKFDSSTVYEPLSIDADKISYKVGNPVVPVHNPYILKLKRKVNSLEEKQFLQVITARGRSRKMFGEREGDWLNFEVKYFGDYSIQLDTIPPVITEKSIPSSTSSGRVLRWGISDGKTGIGDYNLYVGDTWVKLDYEYKNRTLSAKIPSGLTGDFKLTLTVEDKRTNVRTWTKQISIK